MSGHMVGADPDALDELARQYDVAAGRIDTLSRQLSSKLVTAPWHGPAADRFRADWSRSHRTRLAAASAFLHEARDTLRRQADDQRRASGGPGAGSGPRGVWGTLSAAVGVAAASFVRLNTALDPFHKVWSGFLSPGLGALTQLSANRMVTGDYTAAWHRVLAAGDRLGLPADLLRFKTSPVTHFLNPAHTVFESVGKAGTVLSTAFDVVTVGSDLAQHHWISAGLDTGGIAADALKRGNYLAGVAASTWIEVGRAAQDVDWSARGMQQIREASLADWGQAFGEALTQVPSRLVKIFL